MSDWLLRESQVVRRRVTRYACGCMTIQFLEYGSFEMKLYLDDQRPAPIGWVLARNADEAITLLRHGGVTDLSLDYDLGDPHFGTGLDVLDWLERAMTDRKMPLPRLTAHSGSMLGRRRLEAAIDLLDERFGCR